MGRIPLVTPWSAGTSQVGVIGKQPGGGHVPYATVMMNRSAGAPTWWFRMGEAGPFNVGTTIADSSGNGWIMTVGFGSGGHLSAASGLLISDANGAITNDGSGSLIGTAGSLLGPRLNVSWTLVCLAKFAALPPHGQVLVYGAGPGNSDNGAADLEIDSSGHVVCGHSSGYTQYCTSPGTIPTNTVVWIMGTYNSADNKYRLYVNNLTPVVSGAAANQTLAGGQFPSLFDTSDGGSYFRIAATVDEAACWGSAALTQADATALYNSSIGN